MSEHRSSTICVVVERLDHLCGDDLVYVLFFMFSKCCEIHARAEIKFQNHFGITDTALNWFRSYIAGRTQQVVRLHGSRDQSNIHNINEGAQAHRGVAGFTTATLLHFDDGTYLLSGPVLFQFRSSCSSCPSPTGRHEALAASVCPSTPTTPIFTAHVVTSSRNVSRSVR